MTVEELNELKKEIKDDFLITEQNALNKSLEVPNLYQKYLSYFLRESRVLKKQKVNLDKLYGEKFRHYREDYARDLNKGEIEYYINSDEEYHKLNLEYQLQESICAYLESVALKVKNLSFDIKNFIDLRIFLAGGK